MIAYDHGTKPFSFRLPDFWPSRFPPVQFQSPWLACTVDAPTNPHRAFRYGESPVLHGVGTQLMNGKADGLYGFRLDDEILSGEFDLPGRLGKLVKLSVKEFLKGDPSPLVSRQQINR